MKKVFLFAILLCSLALATVSENETIREFFTCNGTTTTYTFTIPAKSYSEIHVKKRLISTGVEYPLTKDVDYTITYTGASYLEGGVVTITPALAATYEVVIARETAQSQETSSASVTPTSIEASNDKLTRQIQDLQDRINRSVRLMESDADASLEIPVLRADKYLAFNDDNDLIATAGPTGDSDVPVSSFIETLFDDTSGINTSVTLGLINVYNVKTYGATGDGSTDDTTSIQSCVSAAITAGGIVYFPPCDSYYKITTAITCGSNITILGCGTLSQIRNADATAGTDINILYFTAASNFRISNLYLRGSNKSIAASTGTGCGIYLSGCSNFVIENCRIEYCTAEGVLATNSDDGVITKNFFNYNGRAAPAGTAYPADITVYATASNDSTNILISGNTCKSNNGTGIASTISTTGVINGLRIIDNYVYDKVKTGIMFYGGSTVDTVGNTTTQSIIANNHIYDCNWMGIYLNEDVNYVTVQGNYIQNSCIDTSGSLAWGGIGISGNGDGNTGATYISVIGNTIKGWNGYSGIEAHRTNNSIFKDNILIGDGTAAAGTYPAFISIIDGNSNIIIGNEIIGTAATTGGDGVRLQSTDTAIDRTNNVVSYNNIHNPSLQGIRSYYQRYAQINNNNIDTPTQQGIYIYESNDVLVSYNTIVDETAGLANIMVGNEVAGSSNRISIIGNKCISAQATGKGIHIEAATSSDCVVQDNDLSQLTALAVTDQLTNAGTRTQIKNNKFDNAALNGSFTMDGDSSTTVANANITAVSRITLTPTNAAAAALVADTNSPYISARTAGTSFAVSTADATSAAGTETFEYTIE